jgi:hypothetical protein
MEPLKPETGKKLQPKGLEVRLPAASDVDIDEASRLRKGPLEVGKAKE